MDGASLNTKQAWAQDSANGKAIYSPAGGRGARTMLRPSTHPSLEPLSCNQRVVRASR